MWKVVQIHHGHATVMLYAKSDLQPRGIYFCEGRKIYECKSAHYAYI